MALTTDNFRVSMQSVTGCRRDNNLRIRYLDVYLHDNMDIFSNLRPETFHLSPFSNTNIISNIQQPTPLFCFTET